MTESAGLERGYRRLLAAYPASFRREQEEEILAVLLAGARDQRRPSLADAVDVLKSGLGMRLRRVWPAPDQRWADALLVVGAAAPLLVVVTGLLELAVPYPLPPANPAFGWSGPPEFGGLSLLHDRGFDIAIGGQVIIAVVVLLGLRRLGLAVVLAAAAGFWISAAHHPIPEPLWVLGAAAFPLEAVALMAAPGNGRVRWVQRWREGIVLLLAACAIQVLTLMAVATNTFVQMGVLFPEPFPPRSIRGYVAAILVLAVAAVGLALTLKIGRYLLLLVALCYPAIVQQVAGSFHPDIELMGRPTNAHLTALYLPPLLLLAGILIVACTSQRLRAVGLPGSA
jgi:hypothetical protein